MTSSSVTPTALPDRLSIALSPQAHLLLREAAPDEGVPEPAVARRIHEAFASGPTEGLLQLGLTEVATPLPLAFGFWRDFGREFVTALCGVADLEERRETVEVPASLPELERLVAAAPPMQGGEYLRVEVLTALWSGLATALRTQLSAHRGSVQAFLAARNAAWNVVGRVHFHLAENKRDPEHPFAFLATYSTGISAQGKPQHRPLGEAVRASSSARDKHRLLALLAPVQKAAKKSGVAEELVSSGHIFQPLAWTAREAYRFLKDTPALEESGVVVRVPDWWKARQPPRPHVSVSIGKQAPSALGLDALLDFSVQVTLDGEPLGEAELEALRRAADGLVLLKGRWVEVDREKLAQVLAHWKTVEQQAREGLSFAEGMRLLAGATLEESEQPEVVREWTGVQAGPWLEQTLRDLRSGALEGPAIAGLRAELRPYQRAGVRWLSQLCHLRLGACLADDMGLGKTVQVLALLLQLRARAALPGPHLLVVPASLIANWTAEAARFAPSLRLFVAHPSVMESKELAALAPERLEGVDLVITSYGTAPRLEWVAKRAWGLVVLDEAQAIKNPGIKQTRALKGLTALSRIALTGTPIENRVSDLWSLFDFLNPGLLGTAKQFTQFTKRNQSWGPLRELTGPYILRRLKTDKSVISDLPEKTELRAFCGFSKRQAALYQSSVESLTRELETLEKADIKRRGVVLAYLLRFKQLCNHPSLWLGDGGFVPEESGKFERLRELGEVISSRQEKVLVFTQFAQMAGPLSAWLSTIFGRPGLVLTGETPVKQRQALVRRFQEEEGLPFFVLSLKAGGTGLNLTAASHVIHFDRWWNPAVENQATDRAFRIGQRRNVLVHKFVCRGTIEERVDELIASKLTLAKELLEGGGEVKLTELDDAALLKLVSLDLHGVVEGT